MGIDRGIINTAVTYDGKKTRFYKGTEVKQKRAEESNMQSKEERPLCKCVMALL